MKNSYRDAMDALRFTPEQKADMVENLLSAPAAGKVVRPLRFRRFAAAGAAAALVLSLGVAGATGALDSAGEAFAGLFGGGAAETEIIDQIGYPIGASATSNGVTITADAILGDTYSYAIVYSIRRDDGEPLVSQEVLDAGAERNGLLPLSFRSWGASLGMYSGSHGQAFFYDADPADSAIQFVEMMTNDQPLKPGTATVKFQDLSAYTSGDYISHEMLAEGTWRLKFDFAFEDCSVSLPAGQDFTLNGMDATLDAVTLSPLSIQVDYTVHQELAWDEGRDDGQQSDHDREQTYNYFESLPIVITYTDGTTLDLTNAGGGISPENGETVCQKGQIFDTIRPLDEVSSVTVGGIVLPVSTER